MRRLALLVGLLGCKSPPTLASDADAGATSHVPAGAGAAAASGGLDATTAPTDVAPQATEYVAAHDAGQDADATDPLAAAVAALDEPPTGVALPFDVTVISARVTPRGAIFDPLALLQHERWRFRACGRALGADGGAPPGALTIRVGEGGEPLRVETSGGGPVAACLGKAAKSLAFEQPDGGLATVEVALKWTSTRAP